MCESVCVCARESKGEKVCVCERERECARESKGEKVCVRERAHRVDALLEESQAIARLQGGIKSSFSSPVICVTGRRNPTTSSANQGN